MAKDQATNQLNLTVVALVALVAIVGLVALVMNAAAIVKTPVLTGSQFASAEPSAADIAQAQAEVSEGQNVAGQAAHSCRSYQMIVADAIYSGESVKSRAAARLLSWGACA